MPVPSDIEYATQEQFVYPSGAAAASVATAGVSWAWSSWVELISAIDVTIALTGITVYIDPIAFLGTEDFEVEIGVGTAGSEAAVAVFKGRWNNGFVQVGGTRSMQLAIPRKIFIGSRISARVRKGRAEAITCYVSLAYLKPPLDTFTATTKLNKVTAPGAQPTLITLNNGSPWTWPAAFTTLIASTSAAIVIVAWIIPRSQAGRQMEIQLAIGTTPIYTLKLSALSEHGWRALPNPFDGIPSGSLVAARARGTDSGTSSQLFGFSYIEKPL